MEHFSIFFAGTEEGINLFHHSYGES